MSNGQGVAACDPERPTTFFDKTEQNYRNMEQRARECQSRLDNLADQMNGGVPREALGKATNEQDRHPAAFDRCNAAESKMYDAMNQLEESILRMENIGLL